MAAAAAAVVSTVSGGGDDDEGGSGNSGGGEDQPLLLSPSDPAAAFLSGRLLGRSTGCKFASAEVFVASVTVSERRIKGRRKVALKRYDLERRASDADADEAELIRTEARHLRQFLHPNLLPLLGSFVSGSEVVLVFPWMNLGSVRSLVREHFPEGLPETAIAFVLRDVLQALKYLHSKGIVHRSVRCSHILLSDGGPAKLSGLKYACSLLEAGRGMQDRYDYPLHVAETNLSWLSPEFLQQNLLGYNERTDVYALGATACEAANGTPPFAEMPATLMLLEKFRGAAPRLIDSTTFAEQQQQQQQLQLHQQQQDQAVAFPTDQPADSGVGASVGSCTNVNQQGRQQQQQHEQHQQQQQQQDSLYARRTFTDSFHSFVDECCRLEAEARPPAAQLLTAHPFIKQLKKTPMSLASILKSVKSLDGGDGKDEDGASEEDSQLAAGMARLAQPEDDQVEEGEGEEPQWDF